jgi:hypothetical protein
VRSKTRSGMKSGQMQHELDGLIGVIGRHGVRSYLEIGARYGDTFYDVMRSLPIGSRGVCVDLPASLWGSDGTLPHLESACAELQQMGYDITLITGDSQNTEVVAMVEALAPFDACLIDADHRYDGCMADWRNYGRLADMVAFHDIAGEGQRHSEGVNVEVPRVWQEVRGNRYTEIVANRSTMGIGITWNT